MALLKKPSRRFTAIGLIAVAGAVTLSAGLAMAGTSSVVTYTDAGVNSVAGWFAYSPSQVDFTHLNSYLGSSGNSSVENLPVSTTTNVLGGDGIALCDRATGEAAQVGRINIGGGLVDIVAATGKFGAALQNGDPCENGVINPTGTSSTGTFTPVQENLGFSYVTGSATLTGTSGNIPAPGTPLTIPAAQVSVLSGHVTVYVTSVTGGHFTVSATPHGPALAAAGLSGQTAAGSPATWTLVVHAAGQHFQVLLQGVSANDTIDVDALSDPNSHFSWHSHFYAQGSVLLSATDLSHPSESGSADFGTPGGTRFTEGDAGVISDTTGTFPLSGISVPAPNGGSLESSAPNELDRFAHVMVSANPVSLGGSVRHGNAGLQTSAYWTAFPVAATSDGTASGQLKLDPSDFAADNFYIAGGVGLIG